MIATPRLPAVASGQLWPGATAHPFPRYVAIKSCAARNYLNKTSSGTNFQPTTSLHDPDVHVRKHEGNLLLLPQLLARQELFAPVCPSQAARGELAPFWGSPRPSASLLCPSRARVRPSAGHGELGHSVFPRGRSTDSCQQLSLWRRAVNVGSLGYSHWIKFQASSSHCQDRRHVAHSIHIFFKIFTPLQSFRIAPLISDVTIS